MTDGRALSWDAPPPRIGPGETETALTISGVMARLGLLAIIAALLSPFFGAFGLIGVVPFLVLCGMIAVGLFGRASPPDDDVTRLGL